MEKKKPIKKGQKPAVTGGRKKPPKTAVKSNTVKGLEGELYDLIPRLDEEGLRFLIQQAHVHLYNMQVEALNQNIIREQAAEKPKKPVKTSKPGLDIKAGESKSSFYFTYGGDWAMFTDTEMLSLAKIAAGPDSDAERAERIYRWLDRERGDVFGIIPINDKHSPLLIEMVKLLKKNFKVRWK